VEQEAIAACEIEGVEAWLLADFFNTQVSQTTLDDFYGRPMLVFRSTPEESWQGKLRAGLEAFLEALDREPDVGRALIVEVHAAGPEPLERRAETMKRVADFIDSARDVPGNGESPPPIAPEGIVAGIHAIVHARLATGANEGFRELLPEFMYFAVLPYFGSEVAEAEMQSARI